MNTNSFITGSEHLYIFLFCADIFLDAGVIV